MAFTYRSLLPVEKAGEELGQSTGLVQSGKINVSAVFPRGFIRKRVFLRVETIECITVEVNVVHNQILLSIQNKCPYTVFSILYEEWLVK